MKKILSIFMTIFAVSTAFALPFNLKLSENEIIDLTEGKVLVRNIDKDKNMCLKSDNEGAKKIYSVINELNPNYLAEVIQVKPYKGNEDLPKKLRNILEKISDYAGIPYWSERHQRYYDLYSTAVIVGNAQVNENTTQIYADLEMEPFGLIHTPITIEETEDYLFYVSTNNNTLKYEGFNCVKKQNMKSVILLFRDGENWILYGAGGIKALKVSFLEKRIETSFINRIKTFCNFVFTKF